MHRNGAQHWFLHRLFPFALFSFDYTIEQTPDAASFYQSQ